MELREGLAQHIAAVEEHIANIALVEAANCAKDAKDALGRGKSSLESLIHVLAGINSVLDV